MFGETPTGAALLYGIKPVIVAIVAVALVAFARTTLTGPLRIAVAIGVGALWLIGVNELVLLVAALLDGVNAAAIGLMAAVSVQLGASTISDPLTVTLGLGSLAVLVWGRVPSILLVALGMAGLGASALGIGP